MIRMANENKGKKWTNDEITKLKNFASGNTPTRLIAMKLKRTKEGIQAKAQGLNISLRPINKSPYNRRKKK